MEDDRGCRIYDEIIKQGIKKDVFRGIMYGQCRIIGIKTELKR